MDYEQVKLRADLDELAKKTAEHVTETKAAIEAKLAALSTRVETLENAAAAAVKAAAEAKATAEAEAKAKASRKLFAMTPKPAPVKT